MNDFLVGVAQAGLIASGLGLIAMAFAESPGFGLFCLFAGCLAILAVNYIFYGGPK